VKTSSETESAATRPLDLRNLVRSTPLSEHDPPAVRRPIPPRNTLIKALQDLGMLPSPCHETRSPARASEGALPLPPALLEKLPRGDPTRRFQVSPAPFGASQGPGGRPFASVIAATPRALNLILHQPRRIRAGARPPLSHETRRNWQGIPRILDDERLGVLLPLESKPSKDTEIPGRRCPRLPSFRSALWARRSGERERAALLVAEWVMIRMRKHSNLQSPFAHSARSALSRADATPVLVSLSAARAGVRRVNDRPLWGQPFDKLVESQAKERPREG
jgi:hypothetical protein